MQLLQGNNEFHCKGFGSSRRSDAGGLMRSFGSIIAIFVFNFWVNSQSEAKPLPLHLPLDVERAQKVFDHEATYDFRGIVKLSNCSGSLVRFEGARDQDPALILTNGHCVSGAFGGMMPANEFSYHVPSKRTFQFLAQDGSILPGSVAARELLYATITWNDVALYSLEQNYAQIKQKFGVDAIVMNSSRPKLGDPIEILSGYWQQGYSCRIDRFVFELREAEYVSKDSMRYSKGGCETIHGTSGSPILDPRTRTVVGINSTGNDSGGHCTMDNPCEVSENGQIYVEKGRSYGDQTHVFYSCLDSSARLDLTIEGCRLFHKGE